jgi:hypothetical protein
VPGAEVTVLDRDGADRRTYRASFARFAETFPDFTWQSAADGAEQLARELEAAGIRTDDYTGDRYIRLRWLRRLLDEGRLDDDLRWTQEAA